MFEKVVCEWKVKAEDLTAELEASRSESRNYSSEMFRMKAALDEANDQLDIVRRENKNLADEIKDLLNELYGKKKSHWGSGDIFLAQTETLRIYLELDGTTTLHSRHEGH